MQTEFLRCWQPHKLHTKIHRQHHATCVATPDPNVSADQRWSHEIVLRSMNAWNCSWLWHWIAWKTFCPNQCWTDCDVRPFFIILDSFHNGTVASNFGNPHQMVWKKSGVHIFARWCGSCVSCSFTIPRNLTRRWQHCTRPHDNLFQTFHNWAHALSRPVFWPQKITKERVQVS